MEGDFPAVHQAVQHILTRNAGGELKDLSTHFVQVVSKIVSKAVLDDVLLDVTATFLQTNKLTVVQTSEEQHILYEIAKQQQGMSFGKGNSTEQVIDQGDVVGALLQIFNGHFRQTKFFGNVQPLVILHQHLLAVNKQLFPNDFPF